MCKFSPSLTKCTQMATRLNISSQVSHHWWNDFRNNVDEFISTNCNELIKWVLARDILLIYDQILRNNITAPFNNMQTLTFKAQPTNAFFCYRQSNVWRLLPASDYCRACGNQIIKHSSDNETVLGSSHKLGGAAEHLIDGSEKCICQLSFKF